MNNIINKANKTLGFLWRNLKISSIPFKEKAYKAFVRLLLEYSAPVWDPYIQKGAKRLEAVQRWAARFVLNRYHNTSCVSRMLDSLQSTIVPVPKKPRIKELNNFRPVAITPLPMKCLEKNHVEKPFTFCGTKSRPTAIRLPIR